MADIYVATTGADTNAGTQGSPYLTITKASTVAVAGDTVHVAPGNYPGGFTTNANGTSGSFITYVSDTKWGAVIVPPASASVRSAWSNNGDYVEIKDFEVDGTNYISGLAWWIGLRSTGIGSIINGNHVHDIALDPAECQSNGGGGIVVGAGWQQPIHVINNVVHDIGQPYVDEIDRCIWFHGIYFQCAGTIKNNVCYANGYGGITLSHDAYDIDVANNTLVANGTGIHINGAGFVDNTTGLIDFINCSNNIGAFAKRYCIRNASNIGNNNTYTNNLSYQNDLGDLSVQNATPTGTLTSNPLFTDAANHDYTLQAGSPAINSGLSTYAPTTDINGVSRPQGTSVDRGAYELITNLITNRHVGASARTRKRLLG